MDVARSTDIKLAGPFLLPADALEDLDKIVDEAERTFDKLRKAEIAEEVRRRFSHVRERNEYNALSEEEKKEARHKARGSIASSYQFSTSKRQVTITLKSGKKLPAAEKFSQLLAHPDAGSEVPNRFDLELTCGKRKLTVSLGGIWSEEMEIGVSPPEAKGAFDVFSSVRKWGESCQPSAFVYWWHRTTGLHWLVIFFVFWGMWGFLSLQLSPGQLLLRAEGRQLLHKGLTEGDQKRAIEIILALNTGYVPPDTPVVSADWMLWVTIAAVVIAVVYSWGPRNTLGIGAGQNSIKWQIWWVNFVYKGLYVTLILGVGIAVLKDVVKKWLGL